MKSLRYIIAIHKFEGNTGRGDGFYSLKQEVVASLEQNVVDYALMSLQRAGPIVEKNKYKVSAMST